MSSGHGSSRHLLPISEVSEGSPATPAIQRRPSNPLPGLSATASSLRTRRAGVSSSSSASNKTTLDELEENDFDDETPGDFDPALNEAFVSRSSRTSIPASLLRAALNPTKSSNPSATVSAGNGSDLIPRTSSANSSAYSRTALPMTSAPKQSSQPSSKLKGTPARATRYSLPVRAVKPVRTTKTSGKHVVLPSESQLAPLRSHHDDDESEEEEEEVTTSEDDDEEEEDDGSQGVNVALSLQSASGVPESKFTVGAATKEQPVILRGRGVGHDLEAVTQVGKPPAKVPVSAPRPGATISTSRRKVPPPVSGKIVTPPSKSGRIAASSALARAAAQVHQLKQKPTSGFRSSGIRAPPLKPARSGPVYHTFERMAPSARVMTPLPRLTAYSISSSIHLGTLLGFLRREHGVKPRLYDECAYAVYTKPLLPGFGRANVRSAPEPRSASPGAESRREREMEAREEFGYIGTYFEHRGEEDEDIDSDGYIKGGEGRGSDNESRRAHRRRNGDDRQASRESGETSAWESENEPRWDGKRTRSGQENATETETETEAERIDDRADNSLEDRNNLDIASSPQDEELLSTPLAKPVNLTKEGNDSDVEGSERRSFLLDRKRSNSSSSQSDADNYAPSRRNSDRRRTLSRRSGSSGDLTAVDSELHDPDSAGARDMLMQQRAEERDGPNALARSYQSTDTFITADLTSDLEDGANSSRDLPHDSSTSSDKRRMEHTSSFSDAFNLLDPIRESSRSPTPDNNLPLSKDGDLLASPSRPSQQDDQQNDALSRDRSPRRKTRKVRKIRKRTKMTGPNMASHNHDTSANLNTPRPILEALQSAELVILPYGVLVMYNFSAAEERSIIEDVLSSGCARDIMPEEELETEAFHFCYDPNIPTPRIFNDFFTFRAPNHLLKLSLAHAIAQSTKLSVFEERMQNTLEVTSHIPKEMALSGELKLKRREALRLTGRLFKLRVDVNLTSNVLDTPELFWSEASLKLLYDAIRDYLEIDERVENLNERLAVGNDLLEIIHEHIANTAMSKITWIVICLIVVACAVAVGEISARFLVGANRKKQELIQSAASAACARFLIQNRSV